LKRTSLALHFARKHTTLMNKQTKTVFILKKSSKRGLLGPLTLDKVSYIVPKSQFLLAMR